MITVRSRRIDNRICLDIGDSGPGMSEEILERIFDPFFTTKKRGHGTGLGLSISFGIIQAHGGDVRVVSRVGVGTTFTIELPIKQEAAEHTEDGSEKLRPETSTSGRVLVIEDDESISELLRYLLTKEGYDVETLMTGDQGLRMILAQDYDFIVCDLHVPGLDGEQIFEQMKKERPHLTLRMIFMTGDVMSEKARTFLSAGGNPCIIKPFTKESMLNALDRVRQRIG